MAPTRELLGHRPRLGTSAPQDLQHQRDPGLGDGWDSIFRGHFGVDGLPVSPELLLQARP